MKQEAKRSVSRIVQSAAPSNSAPASEVIAPPSNSATTTRPETSPNSNRSALHSVGIGVLLCVVKFLFRRRTFADSEPRCTYPRQKGGIGRPTAGLTTTLLRKGFRTPLTIQPMGEPIAEIVGPI